MTDVLASLAVAMSESLALSLIGKATIIAAAGLLVARAMRNVRASRKYLVLAWTFVVLAGMPVLALLAGPLTIVVRENTLVTAPATALTSAASLNGERDLVARVPGGQSVVVVPTPDRHTVTAGTLAAAGWAIGIVVCLLPMVRTLRRLRLLRRTARVWKEVGAATILRHEDVTVPMTFGLLQPVVLLPNDISEWSDADVERALTHELEHVRRRDWPVHLFVRFICALYWFHPVVWRAGRQLYLEADRACDDAVVRRGDGEAFADQLVALAGRLVSRVPAVVPSMGGGDLSTRVLAMVNPRQARGRAGVACRLLAGVVAIACGAAIAPLKAVEATRGRAAGSDLLSPAEPANERSAVDRVLPLVAPDVRRAPVADRIAWIGASMKGRSQPGAQVAVTDSAQAPARQHSDAATFEVASVKPLPDSTRTSGRYRPEPTRFSGDFSVTDAVAFAYQIQSTRIVGAPPWARSPRYEINASTAPRKPGDIQSMMRHLLEERFALKVHRERRPTPVYALLMSRADGGLGPNLQRVERDCTRRASNLRECSFLWGVDHFRAHGQDWGVFVGSLETRTIVGRPIVDKTGLSGQFDLTLEWNPDVTRLPEGGSNAPTLAELEARPALFTAVREQLGLKLESDTAAMDILVIDSVNRPTPD